MIQHPGFQPDENIDLAGHGFRTGGRPAYDPSKLTIKFKGDFDPAELLADLARDKGVKATNIFPEKDPASSLGNTFILEMDPASLQAIKDELSKNDRVQYVEQVALRYTC